MNEKTSSNKDLLDLKYELFFIFENNFSYIYKIISDEILFKFCDKVKTIKIYLEHVDELIGIINDFLYSSIIIASKLIWLGIGFILQGKLLLILKVIKL